MASAASRCRRWARSCCSLADDGTNRRARFGLHLRGRLRGPRRCSSRPRRRRTARSTRATATSSTRPTCTPRACRSPSTTRSSYQVIIDRPGLDYVIVMEDLTRGVPIPATPTRPMTVDQVANGLRGLARLHSRYWDVLGRDAPGARVGADVGADARASSPGSAGGCPTGSRARRRHAARGGRARYDGDERRRPVGALRASLTKGPVTLLHGDAHIGNTYVLPDDDVGFLDWQVVRRGQLVARRRLLPDRRADDEADRRGERGRPRRTGTSARSTSPSDQRPTVGRGVAALSGVGRVRARDLAVDARHRRLAAAGGLARARAAVRRRVRRAGHPRRARRARRVAGL